MSKHAELIARLEAAEVGSYVLDTDVGRAVGYHVPDMPWSGWHDMNGKHVGLVPSLTVSIDAALALAERLGLEVTTILNDATESLSVRGWNGIYPLSSHIARHCCIAILRALDAQEQK